MKRCAAVVVMSVGCALPLCAQRAVDSAGVRIVDNTKPTWTARERLALAASPRLVLGDTSDATLRFRAVRGVLRLDDGRIVVVDGRQPRIRTYSAEGRLLFERAVDGGTAAMSGPILVVRRLRGDTIAISTGIATLTLHSAADTSARTTRLPFEAQGRPMLLIDVLANGQFITSPLPQPIPQPVGTQWADSLSLTLHGTDGARGRPLGTFPHIQLEQESRGPTAVWLSAIGVFLCAEDRFYAGFGDQYAIRVYGSDGTLRSIIRRAWTPVRITSAEWEQWVVEWSKLWVKEQGTARDSAMNAVRRAPYAETLPAFSAFLVDRTGRLWVRAARWQDAIAAGLLRDMPAVPSQWSVFDVSGVWLGDVEMPARFQPHEIGADYVIGNRIANGVNQLVLYDLTRTPGTDAPMQTRETPVTLWRGNRLLGTLIPRRDSANLAGEGRRRDQFSALLLPPDGAADALVGIMQTRSEIAPNQPVMQSSLLPIAAATNVSARGRSASAAHRGSARSEAQSLRPMTAEELRGVPPEQQLSVRDASGAVIDVDMVSLYEFLPTPGTEASLLEGYPSGVLHNGSFWLVGVTYASPRDARAQTPSPRDRPDRYE